MDERQQLEQAIAALEAQRAVLGDAVVTTALAPLREKLAALQALPAEQQLKYATVLFADVTGSTQLIQHLDPEDILTIMDGALRRFGVVIERYEGRVLRFMGDGLKAIFGVPSAREDDAERAVRAGLAILEESQAYAGYVEAHWGLAGFNIRVGINTGEVILGGGVEADNTAMGMTINLAARMENAAPTGGLRISHATYRHVRGVFDVIADAPLSVKGWDTPIQTYLVRRAKPRAFRVVTRGVEGVETRMVGRDAELRQLQDTFRGVLAECAPHVVTVVAEAGLGKSRLLYEFQNWLDLQPFAIWLFQGRTSPQIALQPYGLTRDLLARRFEIQDSDTADVAREKLVAGLMRFLGPEAEELAHFLGQLIGMDFSASPHLRGVLADAEQVRARAFHAAAQFFAAMGQSNGGPVTVFLDDIHWADDGSLDLFTHLAQVCQNVPIVLVCAARPTLFERRPAWGAELPAHTRLDLRPLSRHTSRELVDELLQKVIDLPTVLRELISGGGEGNPFYIEELIKMLIDDGVIVTGAEAWRVAHERLVAVSVPPTLVGVLQARLDALPPGEKAALQQSAVVGHVFWDAAVAAIHAPSAPALSGLAERELIFQRTTSAFAGAHEYVFKHHVLHDVTYGSVLKRVRRDYHRRVAEWLVARSGERVEEYLSLIANHYEHAGEPATAVSYLRRAGVRAARTSAYPEAIASFQRALSLLDDPAAPPHTPLSLAGSGAAGEGVSRAISSSRAGLLVQLGAVYSTWTGDYAQASPYLHEALALARAIDDQPTLALALGEIGSAVNDQGDFATAQTYLAEALPLARAVGDGVTLSRVLFILGTNASYQGDFAQAIAYHEENLVHSRACGDLLAESDALFGMGTIAVQQGRYAPARAYLEESLDQARAGGNLRGIARALGLLGWVACDSGDYLTARARLQEALVMAQAISDHYWMTLATIFLGDAAVGLGDANGAWAAYRDGVRENWRLKLTPWVLYALPGIAELLVGAGQAERAAELLGLVLTHPQSSAVALHRAGRSRPVVMSALLAEAFAAALERGGALDLAAVVGQIAGEAEKEVT